jgi:uncharacterized NAD(P)/FAD-binding protein YdhS
MSRIAIVGGGASGVLTAAQLLRQSSRVGVPLEITVAEPGSLGAGLAYSTDDLRHRLNVRAIRMSAWPDEPADFLDWIHRNTDPDFLPAGFAPRPWYRRYLLETLEREVAAAPRARFQHVTDRIVDLHPDGGGVCIHARSSAPLRVDATVLAVGHGPPSLSWAPRELRTSQRFVADPWRGGTPLPIVRPGETVLLVGSGLTAVDMAVHYQHASTLSVSRHGLLPLAHTEFDAPPCPPPCLPAELRPSLSVARRMVFRHIHEHDRDWRTATDSLRPLINQIWASWDETSRRKFASTVGRHWERARHRVDPHIAIGLENRMRTGRLCIRAATVVGAVDRPDTISVRLSDGSTVDASLVINCTGSDPVVTGSGAGAGSAFGGNGVISAGPLGLGISTDVHGRLDSVVNLPAWTLGPPRKGQLWETTAIPEIRCQAQDVAVDVLRHLSTSPKGFRCTSRESTLPSSATAAT